MPNDSGQDLSKLEYEFATNPTSEAFIPLARAYLSMGRFVEAMVVCKKGIKTHPELPTGRLIMARIYADQAKHQKAIEELNNLLKTSPQNSDAFRLLGSIHLKLGREEEGIAFLKKAIDANPEDGEAKGELRKVGVDYTPASAIPPEPEPEPEPVVAPAAPVATPRPTPAAGSPMSECKTEPAFPAATSPASRSATPGIRPARQVEQPMVTPIHRRTTKRIADIYSEIDTKDAKPKHGGFKVFAMTGAALFVALIIYVIYTWQAGLKQKEINGHLEAGRIKFNQDSYKGYREALDHYRAIYKLNKEDPEALSRGAFITAVLVGEHGAERDLLKEGEKYLREAAALGQDSTMLIAAQGMMAMYGGGSKSEAIKLLEKGLKDNPDSSVLHTALGIILLDQGKLGEAKDHLLKGAGSSDIRALLGLGDYAIRRSLYREAMQFFNRSLQGDRNHVRSLLYAVLVYVLRGVEPATTAAAADGIKRYRDELEKDASDREKSLATVLVTALKLRSRTTVAAGLQEIQALMKKDSSNPLLHFVAARELRRINKLNDAKEAIQKALRLDSSRPDFVLEEAAIFLALKDWEAARSRALRMQAMDTESGQSHLLVGDAYLGEHNTAKAKEYYEKAREFDDAEAMSHLKLAELYLAPPKVEKDLAQAELELAVNSLNTIGERRKAAEAATMLARIYLEKNRTQEFVAIVRQAMNIDAGYPPPYFLYTLAIDVGNQDGRDAAKESCTKYLELDPSGEYSGNCRELLKKIAG